MPFRIGYVKSSKFQTGFFFLFSFFFWGGGGGGGGGVKQLSVKRGATVYTIFANLKAS